MSGRILRLKNIGAHQLIEEELDQLDKDHDIQLVDLKDIKHGGSTGPDFFPEDFPGNKYFVTSSGKVYGKSGTKDDNGQKVLKIMYGNTDASEYNKVHFQHCPESEPPGSRGTRNSNSHKFRHHVVMSAYGPDEQWCRVDHVDGDPQNNCIENLNIATAQSDASLKQIRSHTRAISNRKNNRSGHEGLGLRKIQNGIGKWYVEIEIKGRRVKKLFQGDTDPRHPPQEAIDYLLEQRNDLFGIDPDRAGEGGGEGGGRGGGDGGEGGEGGEDGEDRGD